MTETLLPFPAFKDQILSPSAIKMWCECPYSCYLRYPMHCKPENANADYFRVGKAGHSILEHWYEELNLESPNIDIEFVEKMKMVAFKYWDRTIDARKREALEGALYNWIKNELQRFKSYKAQKIEDRFKPLAVEQDLTDYNLKLRAIIDKRCIGSTGNQYAMDYKFDSKPPSKKNFNGNLAEIDMKYKVQAALNAMILKTQNIEIKAYYYQFVRYPDTLLSVPLTPSLFIEIEELIKTIRADTTYIKNKKGCFWCGLKASCEAQNTSIHCYTGEI